MSEREAEPSVRVEPPLRCARCDTRIRAFWIPGAEYYPCTKCDGRLCEPCCDAVHGESKEPTS